MVACALLTTVILLQFFVSKTSAATLSTTFANNNGGDGNMFDLCAISTTVQILSFDVNCAGTASINIYVATTTNQQYNAIKASSSLWTLIHQQTITCAGAGLITILNSFNLVTPVTVPGGNCRGFYITRTNTANNLEYTNGNSLGSVYSSDIYLQFLEGIGKTYPFSTEFSVRIWNGRIHYNIITTDTPTSVTMNPTTSPSISPTTAPTIPPSNAPSDSPFKVPSRSPSVSPTTSPSTIPSAAPQNEPTNNPTLAPSATPTTTPITPGAGSVQESTKVIRVTDSDDTLAQQDSSGRDNIGNIVITILIIVLICCVAIAIVLIWRHKKLKHAVFDSDDHGLEGEKYEPDHESNAAATDVSGNMMNNNVYQTGIGHVNMMNNYMYNGNNGVQNKKDIDVVNQINEMDYGVNGTAGVDRMVAIGDNCNVVLPHVIPDVAVTDMGMPINFGEIAGNDGYGNVDDAVPGVDNTNEINYMVNEEGAKLVNLWLDAMGFSMYYNTFIDNGFDSIEIVQSIEDQTILNDIGITVIEHQLKIISEIQKLGD